MNSTAQTGEDLKWVVPYSGILPPLRPVIVQFTPEHERGCSEIKTSNLDQIIDGIILRLSVHTAIWIDILSRFPIGGMHR